MQLDPINPAVNMISIEEFPTDLTQLMGLPSTMVQVRFVKSKTHLVAPLSYSSSNLFIIGAPASTITVFGTEYGIAHHLLCIPTSHKTSFDHMGSEAEQVSQINGLTRTGQVHKPKDMIDGEERTGKGKKALAEEPQRKNRVDEEDIAEFITTLKRNEYSLVEQLKKKQAQI